MPGDACFNETLLDLLVDNGAGVLEPRPIWWVFKEYSDGYKSPDSVGVRSNSTFGKIVSIATMDPVAQTAQILVGMYGDAGMDGVQSLEIDLSQITQLYSQKPTISVRRIPFDVNGDRGQDPLPNGPVDVTGWTTSFQFPTLTISDLDIELHEVLIIELSPPSS